MGVSGNGHNLEYLESVAKKKLFVDYESVPGVINYDILKSVLLEYLPEDNISKKIAQESYFEECSKISIEYLNILRIDFLWIMPNLTSLSLSNNLIEKIERVDSLTNLIELNLSFNKIEKIENLLGLVNLEVLNLYGNKISKIENMDTLTKLKVLSVGGNNISSIECIKYLRKFKSLKSLCLLCTPFKTDIVHSRKTVAGLLPNLVFYNYKLIKSEERSIGKSLNLKMVEEIEKEERAEEEIKAIKAEEAKRVEYLRRAMIDGFDNNDFFEYLMEEDDDGKIIQTVGEETIDFYNAYQHKLYEFSQKMLSVGEEFLLEREEEERKFAVSLASNERISCDTNDKVLHDLRSRRRKLKMELQQIYSILPENSEGDSKQSKEISIVPEYSNPLHDVGLLKKQQTMSLESALKRVKVIKVVFRDFVSQSWYKLMDLEMKRFDIAEELNSKYDMALKDLVDKEVQIFQSIFTDIRDAERDFTSDLKSVMNRIVADFHAQGGNVEQIPSEIRSLFTQPAVLENAIQTSHDLHLLLIDNKEDDILKQLRDWYTKKTGHLSKIESERNRNAVYRLNNFLDYQIKEFKEISHPLLKKCKVLLKVYFE